MTLSERIATRLPRCYKCSQAIRAYEYLEDYSGERRHIVCPAPRGMIVQSPFTRRALRGELPAKGLDR